MSIVTMKIFLFLIGLVFSVGAAFTISEGVKAVMVQSLGRLIEAF